MLQIFPCPLNNHSMLTSTESGDVSKDKSKKDRHKEGACSQQYSRLESGTSSLKKGFYKESKFEW